MGIDFQELGTTIAIGGFVIFALDYLLNPVFCKSTFPLSRMLIRNNSPTMVLAIAVVAALAFGILIDRLSDLVTDDLGLPLVPSESKIRSSVLFDDDDNKSLTVLGSDLHRYGVLNAFGYLETPEDTESIANASYYHAKNVVYTYPTLFKELSRIQFRIEFIRSFWVVSFLLFCFALIFRLVLPSLLRKFPLVLPSLSRKFPAEGCRCAIGQVLFILVLGIIGTKAYIEEEKQFDLRAYGYFTSLVASGREELPKVPSARSGVSSPRSVSGLTAYGKDWIIAVGDNKDTSSPRVYWLDDSRGTHMLAPIKIDWRQHRIPTDLEAVCSHGDEVWIAESSEWEGRYPRLLNLGLGTKRERGVWQVREAVHIKNKGFNVEGIECEKDDAGTWWFLIADRGEGRPDTEVVRFRLDRGDEDTGPILSQVDARRIASPLLAPVDGVRHVSDLEVVDHTLVAVATRDPGDHGPFESVVFSLGCVGSQLQLPQNFSVQTHQSFDAMKIEGLSEIHDGNALVLGADNEMLDDAPWLNVSHFKGKLRPDCAKQG